MIVNIFLTVIAVVALVGNLLVVMLLLKKRDWLKKVHSCLLLALAVQDVLTAIGILVLPGFVQSSNIYRVPQSTILGRWYCSVIWSRYIPFALAITSIYTCLMLAFDRWFAVFRPVSYKRFSASVRAIVIMVTLPWIAGFGFEINTALNVNHLAQSNANANGTYICRWNKFDTTTSGGIIAVVTFTGMIVLPAILMIFVYSKIILRRKEQVIRIIPRLVDLRRNDSIVVENDRESASTAGQDETNSNSTTGLSRYLQSSSNTSLKRLTRIACAASAIVIVCWLPDQFYFFLFQLGLVDLRNKLHDGLIILAFLNTCLNPAIYCFSNKQYAGEFETLLCCVYYQERRESVRQRAQSERT
ncbi:somatostatin receptor type 2-like [Dendronephthya gigantea]|uniref:somatostatin receptor type 2-like n=1 Tax=Dendronephthya gigantea TaxID=151771 RepID=UPI00106929CE|nr:somatostatin receptor type 2-like [Dendronephthya gigantea]